MALLGICRIAQVEKLSFYTLLPLFIWFVLLLLFFYCLIVEVLSHISALISRGKYK